MTLDSSSCRSSASSILEGPFHKQYGSSWRGYAGNLYSAKVICHGAVKRILPLLAYERLSEVELKRLPLIGNAWVIKRTQHSPTFYDGLEWSEATSLDGCPEWKVQVQQNATDDRNKLRRLTISFLIPSLYPDHLNCITLVQYHDFNIPHHALITVADDARLTDICGTFDEWQTDYVPISTTNRNDISTIVATKISPHLRKSILLKSNIIINKYDLLSLDRKKDPTRFTFGVQPFPCEREDLEAEEKKSMVQIRPIPRSPTSERSHELADLRADVDVDMIAVASVDGSDFPQPFLSPEVHRNFLKCGSELVVSVEDQKEHTTPPQVTTKLKRDEESDKKSERQSRSPSILITGSTPLPPPLTTSTVNVTTSAIVSPTIPDVIIQPSEGSGGSPFALIPKTTKTTKKVLKEICKSRDSSASSIHHRGIGQQTATSSPTKRDRVRSSPYATDQSDRKRSGRKKPSDSETSVTTCLAVTPPSSHPDHSFTICEERKPQIQTVAPTPSMSIQAATSRACLSPSAPAEFTNAKSGTSQHLTCISSSRSTSTRQRPAAPPAPVTQSQSSQNLRSRAPPSLRPPKISQEDGRTPRVSRIESRFSQSSSQGPSQPGPTGVFVPPELAVQFAYFLETQRHGDFEGQDVVQTGRRQRVAGTSETRTQSHQHQQEIPYYPDVRSYEAQISQRPRSTVPPNGHAYGQHVIIPDWATSCLTGSNDPNPPYYRYPPPPQYHLNIRYYPEQIGNEQTLLQSPSQSQSRPHQHPQQSAMNRSRPSRPPLVHPNVSQTRYHQYPDAREPMRDPRASLPIHLDPTVDQYMRTRRGRYYAPKDVNVSEPGPSIQAIQFEPNYGRRYDHF